MGGHKVSLGCAALLLLVLSRLIVWKRMFNRVLLLLSLFPVALRIEVSMIIAISTHCPFPLSTQRTISAHNVLDCSFIVMFP